MSSTRPNPALAQVLSQAERSIVRKLAQIIESRGATIEQWRVLAVLSDGGGHPMREIADLIIVPAPTLTRIVDAMIAGNLVYRRADPDDRRRVLIFSSARGRRLYARLSQDIGRYEADLADSVSGLDLQHLAALLTQLIRQVQ